ncbi:hypothetical protein KAR48_09375, partial [bacterium]|nr:hypothetical protein [bacterium]
MAQVGVDTVSVIDVPVYDFIWRKSALDSLHEQRVAKAPAMSGIKMRPARQMISQVSISSAPLSTEVKTV